MALADTSRSSLRYIEEVTWGTTPGTALQDMRFTGESLGTAKQTTVSEEIRSDRQIIDLIETSRQPEGDFSFELSYGTYDDMMRAALFSADWLAVSATNTTTTFTSGTNVIDFGATIPTNIVLGSWIKVAGAANNANNGYHLVTALDAPNGAVTVASTLVTGAAGPSITTSSSYLQNATTFRSFTLEKAFLDVTQFASMTGMAVNTLSLSVGAGEKLSGSLGFIGKAEATMTATALNGGTPTAATTTDIMDAGHHVGVIYEGSTPSALTATFVKKIDFTLSNNLRGQMALANLGNVGIGKGRCAITGTLQAYFADATLYNKFLAHSDSSLHIQLPHPQGSYVIALPRIKFSTGKVVAAGPDQDIMVELPFQAIRHATVGKTIMVHRFP